MSVTLPAVMMSTNWKGYRYAAWVGQFFLTLAVVIEAAGGNWQGALALAGFLVASFAFVVIDLQLPTLFDFLFVVAALLNAGGWVWDLFYLPGPYDEITHAFTTFSITLALSFLVYASMMNVFRNHRILYVLTIASFGIAIGALWEITEWAISVINSIDDTIMDLIMDSIGAGLASIISLWALSEQKPQESTPDTDHQIH